MTTRSQTLAAVSCPRLIDDIAADLITNGSLAYTGARLYDGDSIVEVNLGQLNRYGDGQPQLVVAERIAKAMAYFCRLQKSLSRISDSCLFVVQCDKASTVAWLKFQLAILLFKRRYLSGVPWRLLFVKTSQGSRMDQSEADAESPWHQVGRVKIYSRFKAISQINAINLQQLSCLLDVQQMTDQFGGRAILNGDEWLSFRRTLEPLLTECRTTAKKYVLLLHTLKSVEANYGDEQTWLSLTVRSLDEDVSRLQSALFQVEQRVDNAWNIGNLEVWSLFQNYTSLTKLRSFNDSIKQIESLVGEIKRVRSSARKKTQNCINDLQTAVLIKTCLDQLNSICPTLIEVNAIMAERFNLDQMELVDATILKNKFKDYCSAAVQPKMSEFHAISQQCERALQEDTFVLHPDNHEGIRQQLYEFGAQYASVKTMMAKFKEQLDTAAQCEQILTQVCDWILIGQQFANQLAQQMPLFVKSPEARGCAKKQLDLLTIFLSIYPAVSERQVDDMQRRVEKIGCQRLKQKNQLVRCKWRMVFHALQEAKAKLEMIIDTPTTGEEGQSLSTVDSGPADLEGDYEEPISLRKAQAIAPGVDQLSLTHDYRRHSYAGLNLHKSTPPNDGAKTPMSTRSSPACSTKCALKSTQSSSCTLCQHQSCNDNQAERGSDGKLVERNRQQKGSNVSRLSAVSMLAEGWIRFRFKKGPNSRERFGHHQSSSSRYRSMENIHSQALAGDSKPVGQLLSVPRTMSGPGAAVQPATSENYLQQMVVKELIDTERNYVTSLRYVIENYIPEMLRADLPSQLLGQRNVIFGNIEKIYEFHVSEFLPDLLNHCGAEKVVRQSAAVARQFLQYQNRFNLYSLYNKNKPKSDALMSDCGSAFFQAKQLVLRDKLDLSSYLLKPVQRMGKYVLMLDQLIKGCSKHDGQQLGLLREAKQMVIFQLRHGNDLLAMDSIRGCDLNLKEQGELIRQDEFVVCKSRGGGGGGGGQKRLRRIFLFQNLVLFAKPRKARSNNVPVDVFDYKQSIKMTDVGLTEEVGGSALKFELWFRRRTSNDTFVLQAYTESQRQAWIADISQLLWQQAISNRESRLAEMSSMGVLATNCFELNSVNRIEDRTVMFNRESKLRNTLSCMVSKHDKVDRRPRSWISIASSSSSTWSSISGSTNSYCTRESIPLSYESGIGTDLTTLDECPDDSFTNSWEHEGSEASGSAVGKKVFVEKEEDNNGKGGGGGDKEEGAGGEEGQRASSPEGARSPA